MEVPAACWTVVVLPDYIQDFADFCREGFRGGVEAAVF